MLHASIDSTALGGFSPVHSLFKRCKSCGNSAPACPSCPAGTTCSMTSQTCDQCATTKCIADPNSSSGPPSSGPNVGAIAGGVVGGVIGLAIILGLVWWFVIRPRRQARAEQIEKSSQFNAARSQRKSTNSIASTVLTRASNVIQIAYIPGVTNRSPPETPATLVPPVPPLPGAAPDQHFFMPGDLRDSSWTATTGHQSVSPTLRSSVATTIYRSDAVVSPMPAQQIQRSRANIVSVHNGPESVPNTPTLSVPSVVTPKDAPAVPAITSSQLAKADAMQPSNSSIVARTVMAKPVMVRGASVKKKNSENVTDGGVKAVQITKPEPVASIASSNQFDHHTSTFDGNSSDEEDDTRPSSPSQSTRSKGIDAGPFQDQPHSPGGNSSAVNHQRSVSAGSRHRHTASQSARAPPARVTSPFSDANEVR
ncbi:uncharacterized protein N7459_000161 [Penicillium hispanicum]|uniref:uncharacterized protein n=1 Tax=Penicillium hispanicum TaxID=1080232 RepID=UPI00254120E2|nr:uncharacterized protein N7459_000161 [Penicillium hispanicum]KAJ5593953.1 hypothetical protein N7459_000161 [Penicillium hispanicum]